MTAWPDRSSTVSKALLPGAVTRISGMSTANGAEKSTFFKRSSVMVRPPAAISPTPLIRFGINWSRLVGMNITRHCMDFFG
ncbi:hypothetical protein D3C76_1242040 [compost metagenome]